MRRELAAAGLSGGVLTAILLWCLWFRGGADHDELHTLLLARLWAAGEPLSFHLGSVSRYEGGSWLIGLPVSWLLRLGVPDWAAGPAVAAAIAALTVGAVSGWLAREVGLRAALFGLLAVWAAPEYLHYAQRAWGSIAEALIFVPLLALAYRRWLVGRHLVGALLLGGLAGLGLVASYITVIAVVAGVIVHALQGRRAGVEIAAALLGLVLVFGAWIGVAVPQVEEAWFVRGGRSIGSLLPELLRLDRVLLDLPAAFVGSLRPPSIVPLLGGLGLTLLGLAAGVRGLREPGAVRWLAIYAAVCLPFVAVGGALAPEPESARYALPLLLALLALIVAWDWRACALALLLGLTLWFPRMEPPRHDPALVYAQLGANALDRVHVDRHVVFKAFWRVADAWGKAPLDCGYALDQGRRFEHVVSGARARLAEGGDPEDLHLAPRELDSWLRVARGLGDQRDTYLLCFGRGIAADSRIGPEEQELLDGASPAERAGLERGIAVAEGASNLDELPPRLRHAATLQVRPTPLPRN